jgi:hypothetical protein
VVDQMLTGFDSKWLNTLYLDKILDYANLIQAFSRTNRVCDKTDKPFGLIRYYRVEACQHLIDHNQQIQLLVGLDSLIRIDMRQPIRQIRFKSGISILRKLKNPCRN